LGENPETEIYSEPTWDILEFGDGYIALCLGGVISETAEGQKVVDFIIKPSNLLKKRYGIQDSMLNQNLCMPYRVYEKDLIPLNLFDAANRKWLYVKNFRHEETQMHLWEWRLREENEQLRERNQMLEGENMWLLEQLNLAKTNPAEFIAQGYDVFEKVGTKFVEALKGKKEGEMM